MQASEFAQLLQARRIGKGRWVALCPAHPDSTPSLAISVGRKNPVIFRCMSQGCSAAQILEAMGLSWPDVMEMKAMTPEARRRLDEEKHLAQMERRHGLAIIMQVAEPSRRYYWKATEERIGKDIQRLRDGLYPEEHARRMKREKLDRFIAKHGWDRLWSEWLNTDTGIVASLEYGL